ncbi:MAG TPA: alpha/beta fold hydrolase [Pseudolysinimonas sp.]|nr:alpha/beta fold hydrolase [Pseudolysinimonas sp.]
MTDQKSPSEDRWPHYTAPEFVDVAGTSVAYRRRGTGDALLFLHGLGPTRIWQPMLEQLAGIHDVIAPEHPGFGDSPLPRWIRTFDDLVLHYDAFLDLMGVDRVHLVGHGLGGWAAADLALHYPRRFASVTLIAPSGVRLVDTPSIDVFRMLDHEFRSALFNGRDERYAEFLDQEGAPEDAIRALAEGIPTARLSWNPRYDIRLDHRLARISAPSLVLAVEDDRVVPTSSAARFAELIPHSTLHTIPGRPGEPSSHAVALEQPDVVAAAIAAHTTAS